jgi:hypothetical protein
MDAQSTASTVVSTQKFPSLIERYYAQLFVPGMYAHGLSILIVSRNL